MNHELEPHPCQVAPGEFEHDMEYIEDWGGDPGVIGGTFTECYYQCKNCGQCENGDPPSDEEDFYDRDS